MILPQLVIDGFEKTDNEKDQILDFFEVLVGRVSNIISYNISQQSGIFAINLTHKYNKPFFVVRKSSNKRSIYLSRF